MSETLRLERFADHPDMGAFGELVLPNDDAVFTVERPWLGNEVGESCIPEGVYLMRKRRSGVVERTTKWKKVDGAWQRSDEPRYLEGWEITSVQDRTYIMVHPANTMDDLEGCIGPGMKLGCVGGRWAVMESQEALDRVMEALAKRDEWMIDIRWKPAPQWP